MYLLCDLSDNISVEVIIFLPYVFMILLCVRGKCQTGQIQKHILLQHDFRHQSIRSPSDLCSVMHFHRQAPKPLTPAGSHAFLLLLPTSTGNYTISRSLYKLKHSFMTMCIFYICMQQCYWWAAQQTLVIFEKL